MNIGELNAEIKNNEYVLNKLKEELKVTKSIFNSAFSGNDNWRERQSVGKRIPVTQKKIDTLIKKLILLKEEKAKIEDDMKSKNAYQRSLISNNIENKNVKNVKNVKKDSGMQNPIMALDPITSSEI